jgi:hypothetical protein
MSTPEPARQAIEIPDQVEYGSDEPESAPSAATWSEVDARLRTERYFWLVVIRPDGRSHAVAVWGIWEDGCLWFTMSPRTRTARHLARDPRVLVHLPDAANAVVLEGEGRQAAPATVPVTVVDRYEATYGWRLDPADDQMPYFAVRASLVRAWSAADVRGTATRWDLLSG